MVVNEKQMDIHCGYMSTNDIYYHYWTEQKGDIYHVSQGETKTSQEAFITWDLVITNILLTACTRILLLANTWSIQTKKPFLQAWLQAREPIDEYTSPLVGPNWGLSQWSFSGSSPCSSCPQRSNTGQTVAKDLCFWGSLGDNAIYWWFLEGWTSSVCKKKKIIHFCKMISLCYVV